MKPNIDLAAVKDFAISLGQMISLIPPEGVNPNPRPMMLTYAVAGTEGDFEADSRALGMDLVVLAFEPGRERDGPTNIAVYEEREGRLTAWRNCSAWAFSGTGPCLIMVNDGDVGFGYDGASLVVHWKVPTDRRQERVEAGRMILKLMSQCLPPHQQVERRLDPPIRIVSGSGAD